MPSPPLTLGIAGSQQIADAFNALNQKAQRQLINKAGLPILKDIRHSARWNMIRVFGKMKRSGKNVGFNMAESLGFKRSFKRGVASISLAVMYKQARTNKLAHLIEWGFHNKLAGRRVAGNYPMTDAFNQHKDIVADRFAIELAAFVKETKAKGGPNVN